MSSPETSPPSRPERWLILLPVLLGMSANVLTIGAGLVLEDRVLVDRAAELESLAPRQRFIESYLPPDRLDPGYRPLTYTTFAAETVLGALPWARHAINLTLHGLAAALVFLVFRELLGDARVAAAGAGVFAVLPIGVDAVASILGRGELLAALALFAIWWLALRERPADERGRLRRASLVAALTLAGLFAHEQALWVAPALPVVVALCLGRAIPWLQVVASGSALIGYAAFGGLVLEGRTGLISPLLNPLADLEGAPRVLYGASLLGDYALTTVLPLQLSAEYGRVDLTLPPSGGGVAVAKLSLAAALVAGAVLLRKRAPAASMALAFFLLALLPHLNLLALSRSAFAERSGYAAAAAFPLLVCALADRRLGPQRRGLLLAGLAVLALLHGGRTVVRGLEWLREQEGPPRLVRRPEVEARARDLFTALEGLILETKRPDRRYDLFRRSAIEAQLAIDGAPNGGWGEALRGNLLYQEGKKYAEAVEVLTRAEALLAARMPPVAEPMLYKLRGNAQLYLGKARESMADLERSLALSKSLGRPPDPVVLARRGNCRGQLGDLHGALADFNAAIDAETRRVSDSPGERSRLPELWNNRGFCQFRLGDIAGALNDYSTGYTLCKELGLAYFPPPADSQYGFLLKLADIYDLIAAGKTQVEVGVTREEAASRSALFKQEAARLLPQKTPRK